MLTRMTENDWEIAVEVLRAVRSRRGERGHDDRKFLEALHYHRAQHHVAGAAGRVRQLEQRVEALLAAESIGHVRGVLLGPGRTPARARIWCRCSTPRSCGRTCRRRAQKGADAQALGRSHQDRLRRPSDRVPPDRRRGQRQLQLRDPAQYRPRRRAARGDRRQGLRCQGNREAARDRGICPVIPYRNSAKERPKFLAKALYKGRARIEQAVGKTQEVQARCHALRKDGAELRIIRRPCLRLHLDHIRPHGLDLSCVKVHEDFFFWNL